MTIQPDEADYPIEDDDDVDFTKNAAYTRLEIDNSKNQLMSLEQGMEEDEDEDQGQNAASEQKNKSDTSMIGSLRIEAVNRRERLRQLRLKALQAKSDKTADIAELEKQGDLLKPVFRNYKPLSADLKDGELPMGKPVDLNKYISSQLEAAEAPVIIEEVNLANLAPRKPDWDLKRGVEKKLRKLEKRMQRTIAQLIRERLETQSNNEQ